MIHITRSSNSFRRRMVDTACLTVLAAAWTGGATHAQTAQAAGSGDEVVVIGRPSINPPTPQIKRDESAIIDLVTAADVDKTVDTLLPDALSRLTGVSTTPFYGTTESGYVSIRGFDSRYNSLEIDGVPILISSQNNRGAQIGMIPSSIIAEADVYKTVRPDQDANSIGGHIAMRTLRAFDGGDRPYFKLDGEIGDYDQENALDKGPSGRVNGVGKFTFGQDHQFGFVFGGAYQRYRYSDNYGGEDGYTQVNGQDVPVGNLYNGSTYQVSKANTSLYGKLEMRRSDKLYAFLSGSYFNEDRQMYLDREGAYIANAGARTITSTGPDMANFTGGQGEIREYDYTMNRNAKMASFGVDYTPFDKGSVSVRGNYTDYSNRTRTRNLGAGFNLTGAAGAYDIGGDVPVVTPANPTSYNNPANWIYSNTGADYLRTQPLNDTIYAVRADFNYNTFEGAKGFGVSAGASWTRLDRDFSQTSSAFTLPTKPALTLATITPAGATMANNAAILMNWNSFWSYMAANGTETTTFSPTASYRLEEDTPAAYLALHYVYSQFRVMAGFRYEGASDDIDTANLVSNVVTPVHNHTRYGEWLPNIQASYDFTPALRLRGAFTQTIARPDFSDFAPGTTNGINSNGIPTVSGSNPNLGPRKSTNLDASLEYYLHGGLLSLAMFHKDIAHEEFSQMTNVLNSSGQLTEIETVPLNTGKAKVSGLELSAAKTHLDFLPGPLSNFGVNANYTYIKGVWDVVFTNDTTRSVDGLRNQPKWLANLQVSYDARFAQIYLNYQLTGRTFTGAFGSTSAGDIWYAPYDNLSLKVFVPIRRNLKLTFVANNLTQSYIRQTTGVDKSIYNSVGVGRSFFGGFKCEF